MTARNTPDDTTVTDVAGTPPNVTAGEPTKPAPDTVTNVPPDCGPDAGDTDVTTGATAGAESEYVNRLPTTARDVPEDVSTRTSTRDGRPGGAIATNDVTDPRTNDNAGNDPKRTAVTPMNARPVKVTTDPPDTGPDDGDTFDTDGTTAVYVNTDPNTEALDPADDCTVTDTTPGPAPSGATTTNRDDDTRRHDTTARSPNRTPDTPSKPDPDTVTDVPPVTGPDTRDNDTTTGAPTAPTTDPRSGRPTTTNRHDNNHAKRRNATPTPINTPTRTEAIPSPTPNPVNYTNVSHDTKLTHSDGLTDPSRVEPG